MDGKSSGEGLILSGGGADGAYAVGVIRALAEGRSPSTGHHPLDPAVITGTSVGSINAVALLSGGDDLAHASRRLQSLWLDRLAERPHGCGNGVFRFRGNPLRFLDPRCYLGDPAGALLDLVQDGSFFAWMGLRNSVELAGEPGRLVPGLLDAFDLTALISRAPLERTLREELSYAGVRSSRRQLLVAATNWASGELKLFSNSDFTDSMGPRLLEASSAIPGFFPPAEVAGEPYVDGGVLMNTPLRPAIHAGAQVLHVIYLDPDVANIPVPRINGLLGVLYRSQVIAWAERMNDDVEDARAVNEGLAVLHRAGQEGGISSTEARGLLHSLHRFSRVRELFGRYRPLTIHRYHPREELSGVTGLLDLRRDRLEALIRRGEGDAESHDCDESQCVLPPPDLLAAHAAARGTGAGS